MSNYPNTSDIRYFKGNPIRTSAGIFAWVLMLLFPCLLLLFGMWKAALMVLVLFFIICFLPISASLNYFGVSPYFFEVRNHYLLWKRRKIYFEEIQGIFLEKWGNNNCVTVLLRNDKKKKFSGLTLKAEHWVALKQEIASRNIPVTDRNNFEQQLDPLAKKYSRLMLQRLGLWALCTMPVSYFVTTWVRETEGIILIRLLALAAAFGVCGFAMVKVMRATSRQYERAKAERDNSGTLQ